MVDTCVINNEILISNEPEFMPCKYLEAKVQYFVVCKKGKQVGSVDVFDLEIAGEKLFNWVVRACEDAEVLNLNDYQNEFEVIKSLNLDSDYIVILNGNIPLLNKQRLKDIIGFVIRKNMNVCRLKNGIIFKTEYFLQVDEVYSSDVYSFKTNDFFDVVNFETFEIAKNEIKNRICAFYSKNGVNISSNVSIDANVQIGYDSTISENAIILKNSKLKDNVFVGKNSIIEKTVIDNNCNIGDNVVIKNSIIGANVKIGDNVYLENCEILNGCEIKACSNIIDTNISMGAVVGKMCSLIACEIGENAVIGNMSRLYRAEIEKDYDVFDGKVIIHREEK